MANIMDYLTWRGDLTVKAAPWNEVDTLICATFCYIELNESAEGEHQTTIAEICPQLPLKEMAPDRFVNKRRALALAMADTVRYAQIKLHHFVNQTNENTQFSAMTMDVPDGPRVVAFRGTDATLTGWKEDCCMSYETVPAQTLAQAYLYRTILTTEAERPLIVCGHSKGGNLAAYAAAHLSEEEQTRLTAVYSFDGPGLDDATIASNGYERLRGRMFSIIPQGSVVGLLMGFHPKFTVIHSTENGIYQHDNFSWQLIGPAFEVLDSNNRPSQFINDTVHRWLNQCSPEQRRIFVNYLFDFLAYGKAETTDDLKADKSKTLTAFAEAAKELDPEGRKVFTQMLGMLVTSGASTAFGQLGSFVPEVTAGVKQRIESLNLPDVTATVKQKIESFSLPDMAEGVKQRIENLAVRGEKITEKMAEKHMEKQLIKGETV